MGRQAENARLPVYLHQLIRKGNNTLQQVEVFRNLVPEVYVIGDNLEPSNLHYCLHAAYEAVMAL